MKVVLGSLALVGCLYAAGTVAAVEDVLTMEDFFRARWPSRASWSPDGRYVSYLSTDWTEQGLFVASADGDEPVPLVKDEGFVGGTSWDAVDGFGSWSRDSGRLAFNVRGDVRVVAIADKHTTSLGRASLDSEVRFSPTDDSVAYIRDGDVIIADVRQRSTRNLTRGAQLGSSIWWSPDGRLLATAITAGVERSSASPSFLGTLSMNWSVRGTRRVAIVDARSGAVRTIGADGEDHLMLGWSPDSKTMLVEQRAHSFKERSIRLVSASDLLSSRVLYQQREPRHLATNNQVAAFSPDGRAVLFTSDADGWNHLYVVATAAGSPRQLTQGEFEVSFPTWSADGRSISFASTQGGPAERHIFRISASGGTPVQLTREAGVNTIPMPSPVGGRLLFVHTDAHRLPDYWMIDSTSATRQVTHSMVAALHADRWQTPRIVSFTSKGGVRIWAQLFIPPNLDESRTYPAVVQVHEASTMNQHVFLGPGPQKNQVGWYGWHQRLASRGYVVLNIDYRGSFGYGRDFRTADYLVMGHDPLEDVVAGVEFVRTLAPVDPTRVGVVGLSAGGRMVLSLLEKYSETFAAGVDVAGIYDYLLPGGPWDTRNPWTTARLGTPEAHPEAYRDASPRTLVANIRKPLLVMHGTADTNVPVAHSLALIEDLLALGKRFEFAVYPGEVHFFARRTSWLDAFDRIEGFLDHHLSSGSADMPRLQARPRSRAEDAQR